MAVQLTASGLPLPPGGRFVQSLVRAYIPTAIATLIEHIWILMNRLICVMQSFEELRSSRAPASRLLLQNYASLPPPLKLFKATFLGHYILATVCAMTLLANVLATSFAGLFFIASTAVSHPFCFNPPLEPLFLPINGTACPNLASTYRLHDNDSRQYPGAYQDSPGDEQFLALDTNYTRATSLSSWVDETAMYLPLGKSPLSNPDGIYEARTTYFSAAPNCQALAFGTDYRMILWNRDQSAILNGMADVIAQSDQFIFLELLSRWHNVSCPGEHVPYFMNLVEGNDHLTNPLKPLPTFADIETPLNMAYTRLFALWLGINKDMLFKRAGSATKPVEGMIVVQEERFFFFTVSLFITFEVILGILRYCLYNNLHSSPWPLLVTHADFSRCDNRALCFERCREGSTKHKPHEEP